MYLDNKQSLALMNMVSRWMALCRHWDSLSNQLRSIGTRGDDLTAVLLLSSYLRSKRDYNSRAQPRE
jgi:hypothetical protein